MILVIDRNNDNATIKFWGDTLSLQLRSRLSKEYWGLINSLLFKERPKKAGSGWKKLRYLAQKSFLDFLLRISVNEIKYEILTVIFPFFPPDFPLKLNRWIYEWHDNACCPGSEKYSSLVFINRDCLGILMEFFVLQGPRYNIMQTTLSSAVALIPICGSDNFCLYTYLSFSLSLSPSITKSTNKYFGILQVDWIRVSVTVSRFLIFTFALSIVLLKNHPRKLNSIAQLYLMRPKSEIKNERPPIVCS